MSDTTQQTTAIKYDAGFDEIIAAMASPEFRQNPYDLYRRLRREYPVYRSSQRAWYLTRYADVDGALRNPQLSRDRERILRWQAQLGLTKEDSELQQSLSQSMLNADPPDHTRLRNLVNQAFTPRRVEALRPWIETMVDQLLDTAVAAGPSIDLIAALAEPLPVMVICELLGVPDADRHHISEWTQQFIDQASYAPTREALQHSAQVLCAFEDYLRELIRRRRAHPGDDLISALVTMQERGDHLTEDELLGTCFLLLVAGHVTTVNLIGNGTLALLRHPDQARRLRDDHILISSAVEELLRYDSPIQMTLWIVVGTMEIGGQTLRDGDAVFPVLGAANRDPERFADPDQLDIARADNRHLTFASGPHFCLGSSLARIDGQIAIGTLMRRLPRLQLDTDTVQWRPNSRLRGLVSLPVTY
jgi:cytochrome P450